MKKQEAEIIDIDEVRAAKTDGSGGGFDHFTTMVPGTVFAVAPNGYSGSQVTEYILIEKRGLTVLLGTYDELNNQLTQRHIGAKFWKLNTMVQILHIPEKKEEQNGKGADV